MNEFLEALANIVNGFFPNSAKNQAEQGQEIPYAVYDLLPLGDGLADSLNNKLFNLIVTINYRDEQNIDSGAITTLIDNLDKALTGACFNGATYYANSYFTSRGDQTESDAELRKEQLQYQIDFTSRN